MTLLVLFLAACATPALGEPVVNVPDPFKSTQEGIFHIL
jgi:hypothetical protein